MVAATAAELSPLHADALGELGNICGGRAADALSRLLGERPVSLALTEARLPRDQVAERLGGAAASVVGLRVALTGPVDGELWLVLRQRDADVLSRLLGAHHAGAASGALYEAANIVASACLNALYALTRLTVVPSVPEVTALSAGELCARLGRGVMPESPVVTTELRLRDENVSGRLLFVPHARCVGPLLLAMGIT